MTPPDFNWAISNGILFKGQEGNKAKKCLRIRGWLYKVPNPNKKEDGV
jgi:hypothetical protein